MPLGSTHHPGIMTAAATKAMETSIYPILMNWLATNPMEESLMYDAITQLPYDKPVVQVNINRKTTNLMNSEPFYGHDLTSARGARTDKLAN